MSAAQDTSRSRSSSKSERLPNEPPSRRAFANELRRLRRRILLDNARSLAPALGSRI
jgi:hypothetical protein